MRLERPVSWRERPRAATESSNAAIEAAEKKRARRDEEGRGGKEAEEDEGEVDVETEEEDAVGAVTVEVLRKRVRSAMDRVDLIHGDFCKEDLSDATVIFINNAVFEPDLMAALLARLAALPKLRRVVCLRKLCYRHGRRCESLGLPCCAFVHPPKEDVIKVRDAPLVPALAKQGTLVWVIRRLLTAPSLSRSVPLLRSRSQPTWTTETTLFSYQRTPSLHHFWATK